MDSDEKKAINEVCAFEQAAFDDIGGFGGLLDSEVPPTDRRIRLEEFVKAFLQTGIKNGILIPEEDRGSEE